MKQLPDDTEFNIDTIDFTVGNAEVKLESLSPTYQQVIRDGESVHSQSNRVMISGFEGRHKLGVRYKDVEKSFNVEGAMYAFLYGQNVFTSNELSTICFSVLKKLKSKVGLERRCKFNSKVLPWCAEDIELNRVDIAVNFRFKTSAQVKKVLQQICVQLNSSKSSVSRVRTSVYWNPYYGKKFSILFYAKGEQMEAKNMRDNSTSNKEYVQLIQECENVLRVELKLWRSELKKLGFENVSRWDSQTPKKLFLRFYKRMQILNVYSGPLHESDFVGISDRMKPVLALIKQGVDRKLIYADRTIARQNKYFRGIDRDINVPVSEVKTIKLGSLLAHRNRLATAPEWLTLCQKR